MLGYLNFLLDLIKGRLFSQVKPLIVGLNVTNRCNLRCPYCYGDYFNRKARDFTKEELLNLIDKLKKMGTRIIYLSGGEPLMRKDIEEIINSIKEKAMLCFMTTNGILVPDKIKSLKKLDSLTISLDGDKNTNDINRGQGTFVKIVKAIKVAKAEGLSVSTNTVINRNNLDSIEGIISLVKNLGVTAEFNLPYEQTLGNMNNPVMHLEDDEIRTILQKLIEYKEHGAPIFFSIASRKYALNWPFSCSQKIIYNNLPPDFKIVDCYMGRFMCLIDSDGLVYPCGQLIGRFRALNIHQVGFEKAWENLLKKKTCKTCYCVCYNEFNRLFKLNPEALFSNSLRALNKIIRK